MKRITFSAILLAIAMGIYAQPNVTQVEYFLDADNGIGMNTILDITSPDVDIIDAVLANIPPSTSIGYHKLYIRVKDENGHWSQTVRKHIEIAAPLTANNVVMGEYFLDEDYGYGAATSFTINPQEEDIEQAFSAQIAGTTTLGYHKLFGRVQDNNGNWSLTFRKNIEVYLNPDTNIVEIEYFFDSDLEFGNNTIVSIDEPEVDGTWNFYVPFPEGPYDVNVDGPLFVRAKDSNDKWSITTTLDEVDPNLSVSEVVENSLFKVYPNPTDGFINISSSVDITITNTVIYDLTGKTLYQSKQNLHQLDVSSFPSGIYILNLTSDKGSASYKLIKK